MAKVSTWPNDRGIKCPVSQKRLAVDTFELVVFDAFGDHSVQLRFFSGRRFRTLLLLAIILTLLQPNLLSVVPVAVETNVQFWIL